MSLIQNKVINFILHNAKLSLFLLLSFDLYGQTKTFIREYNYTASEADSKITARTLSLNHVKNYLLEEIGVYVENSFLLAKNEDASGYSETTKSLVTCITAGITQTKIVEEKWNGESYYIKAEITVDLKDLERKLNQVISDRQKSIELEEVKKEADLAYEKIEDLKKQLEEAKNSVLKESIEKEYVLNIKRLSSFDWFHKGYNYAVAKQYQNAIHCYEKCITDNPELTPAYNNLGIIYLYYEEYSKSENLFQQAQRLEPLNASVYNNLGLLYKQKGNLVKAIEYYNKSMQLDQSFPQTYNNLANALYKFGSKNESIGILEKAIRLFPAVPESYYNLGVIFNNEGENTNAIEMFKKAAALGDKDAMKVLIQN